MLNLLDVKKTVSGLTGGAADKAHPNPASGNSVGALPPFVPGKLSTRAWNRELNDADGAELDLVEQEVVVGNEAVEQAFRKAVSAYAVKCMESQSFARIGKEVKITKVTYIPSYFVNVETQYASRTLVRESAPTADPLRRAEKEEAGDLWRTVELEDRVLGETRQVKHVFNETYQVEACEFCDATGEHTCIRCNGSRVNTCSACAGQGKSKCRKCEGRGQEKCRRCDGAGHRRNGEKCRECQMGFRPCDCDGGYINCSGCANAGRVVCDRCDVNGRHTCISCDGRRHKGTWLAAFADTCSIHHREASPNGRLDLACHNDMLSQSTQCELVMSRSDPDAAITVKAIPRLKSLCESMTNRVLSENPSPSCSGKQIEQTHRRTLQKVGIEVQPSWLIEYEYRDISYTATLVGQDMRPEFHLDPLLDLNKLVARAMGFAPFGYMKSLGNKQWGKAFDGYVHGMTVMIPGLGLLKVKEAQKILEELKTLGIEKGQTELKNGILIGYFTQVVMLFSILTFIIMLFRK